MLQSIPASANSSVPASTNSFTNQVQACQSRKVRELAIEVLQTQNAHRSPRFTTPSKHLIAQEIVSSKRLTKLGSLLPHVEIVAHAMQIAERLSISRSMGLALELLRLLEKEE